jgi:2-dehydro-3-deoxygalactonokinase
VTQTLAERTCWIAVDWGSTHLRVWAVNTNDQVIARDWSEQGLNNIQENGFERALLDLVEPWLDEGVVTKVVACGVVGARQGWCESAYQETPCHPLQDAQFTKVNCKDNRISVTIVAGVMQAHPVDIMRGEETQIAGFLSDQNDFNGVVCLPGTHAKWALIESHQLMHFTTFMTGELFDLLANHSVLKHTVAAQGWQPEAFARSLQQAYSEPSLVTAQLFSLRAGAIVDGLPAAEARARLSGLLIGLELKAAEGYWRDKEVVILGSSSLAKLYHQALIIIGVGARIVDNERLTVAGLSCAYSQLIQGKG